jgi:hypothetical protein
MGIHPMSYGHHGVVPDPPQFPEPTEDELVRETLEEFYLTNHDFNIFVNKGCQAYSRTLQEMLDDAITWEYYLSMQKGGCNEERNGRGTDTRSNGQTGAKAATCE